LRKNCKMIKFLPAGWYASVLAQRGINTSRFSVICHPFGYTRCLSSRQRLTFIIFEQPVGMPSIWVSSSTSCSINVVACMYHGLFQSDRAHVITNANARYNRI
jgi:hypothetical protein